MAYRINDIEVPSDDPFKNDALGRKPLVEFLSGLIDRLPGPFVMAIDSPWGSGKTTLVRMLMAHLIGNKYQCVYFNAWKTDYITDPLVALVSCFDDIDLGEGKPASNYKEHLEAVKTITTKVAKRGVIAAVKLATAGVLDLEKDIEAIISAGAADVAGDVVDAFNQEKQSLEKFRDELTAAVGQLPAAGKKANLIFFIDELDRCRPTFAIELLERVKHLFDIPNVVFVLSLDKQQLEASTAAVYGEKINALEYLRRFIDLEYGLPVVNSEKYIESLLAGFGLDPAFNMRIGARGGDDRGTFVRGFILLSKLTSLSLRAIERCITRLSVVMDQTPPNGYLCPVLIALLIVLRANHPQLFARFISGAASPEDVMDYLDSLSGQEKIRSTNDGILFYVYLLAADPNRRRSETRLEQLKLEAGDLSLSEKKRQYASSVLDRHERIFRGDLWDERLDWVASKIDLAARIQE